MQALLPEQRLWAAFCKGQVQRSEYLKPNDVMTARIISLDGAIDLGEQRVTITSAT